jgi:hypothetical protein
VLKRGTAQRNNVTFFIPGALVRHDFTKAAISPGGADRHVPRSIHATGRFAPRGPGLHGLSALGAPFGFTVKRLAISRAAISSFWSVNRWSGVMAGFSRFGDRSSTRG